MSDTNATKYRKAMAAGTQIIQVLNEQEQQALAHAPQKQANMLAYLERHKPDFPTTFLTATVIALVCAIIGGLLGDLAGMVRGALLGFVFCFVEGYFTPKRTHKEAVEIVEGSIEETLATYERDHEFIRRLLSYAQDEKYADLWYHRMLSVANRTCSLDAALRGAAQDFGIILTAKNNDLLMYFQREKAVHDDIQQRIAQVFNTESV